MAPYREQFIEFCIFYARDSFKTLLPRLAA